MINLKSFINKTLMAGAVSLAVLGSNANASIFDNTKRCEVVQELEETSCPLSQSAPRKAPKEKYKDNRRSNLSIDYNYANLTLNGREKRAGISIGLESRLDLNFFDLPSGAYTDIYFNHQNYGMRGDVSEMGNNIDAELGIRGDIFSSNNLRIHLDVGAKYFMDRKDMVFKGINAYISKDLGGMALSLWFESEHFDASLSFSELFGVRSSSYKKSINLMAEQASINVKPKFWRVEVPTSIDVLYGDAINSSKEYPDAIIRFTLRPELSVTENLSAFINFVNTYRLGAEEYNLVEIGGGLNVKW